MMLQVMARITLLKCTTENICIAFVGNSPSNNRHSLGYEKLGCLEGSSCSILSFLPRSLFVLLLLGIALYVLRFPASDYPFDICKHIFVYTNTKQLFILT